VFAPRGARIDIRQVSPSAHAPRDIPRGEISAGRVILLVGPIALALTLLSTVQEMLRRGPTLRAEDFWHALVLNALDWCSVALLIPIIVAVGRRFRLDLPERRTMSVLVWLALAVACSIAQSLITGLVVLNVPLLRRGAFPPGVPPDRLLAMWTISTFGFNAILIAMIAGVTHAALSYADAQARRVREAQLEGRVARAELNVLRMQLQPHFFFNALHTVSSLMMSDVAAAQQVIAALGELVRASIDHTASQEVSVREELAFVSRYIDIQKARFRQRLTVEIRAPGDTLDALVPSLVLQPLVENAVRHGIERRTGGGRITIDIVRQDGQLSMRVRDGPQSAGGATPLEEPPATGVPGIGLVNLEARLAQLYGGEQRFRAGRITTGEFEVAVTVPYHTTPAT